jgi:hypothetical protein
MTKRERVGDDDEIRKRLRTNDDENNTTSTSTVYVYELKCVMHSTVIKPEYSSILLFTTNHHHWEHAFPFYPFHTSEKNNLFVSPLFLFTTEMNDNQMIQLKSWCHMLLSKEQGYEFITRDEVRSNELFFMTPFKDCQLLLDALSKLVRKKQEDKKSYSFDLIYKAMQSVFEQDDEIIELAGDSCTLQTLILQQSQLLGLHISHLSKHINQAVEEMNYEQFIYAGEYNQKVLTYYKRFSLPFQDIIVVDTMTQQLYITEFLDIVTPDVKFRVACRPVTSIVDIHLSTNTVSLFLEQYFSRKVENTQFLDSDRLTAISLSFGVFSIFQQELEIRLQFEKMSNHSQSVKQLCEKFSIPNFLLVRRCFIDDAYAMWNGNREIGNYKLRYIGSHLLYLLSLEYMRSQHAEASIAQIKQQVEQYITTENLASKFEQLGMQQCLLTKDNPSDEQRANTFRSLVTAIFMTQKGSDILKKEALPMIFNINSIPASNVIFPDSVYLKQLELLEQFLTHKFKFRNNVADAVSFILFNLTHMYSKFLQ